MSNAIHGMKRVEADVKIHIGLDDGLFIMLLGLILLVRVSHLNYNTLFLDEALYLNFGRDLLAGTANWQQVVSVFAGSPLYPFMAGLADLWAGVSGARFLSAVLSTLAAACMFGVTRRLFGRPAALWGMLVFGFTGASISLGQMAVYDGACIFFLSLAWYCVVLAAERQGWRERAFLLGGAVSFSLAALSKYTGTFYLPALLLTSFALYVIHNRTRHMGLLIAYFLVPLGLILGTYTVSYLPGLIVVITQQGFEHATRWAVLRVITDEIGFAIALAVLGAAILPALASHPAKANEAPVVQALSSYLRGRKFMLGLAIFFVSGLLVAFLTLPLYQLLSSNIRSVWKATIASLIFLSPLDGFVIAWVIGRFRSRTIRVRALGAVLTVLALYAATSYGLDRNWGLQNSWPNIEKAVAYLQAHGLSTHSRVLAEGGPSYLYYFHFGPGVGEGITDTYSMEYSSLHGAEAMTAAIRDHYFDFVVLDDNFTPTLNSQLEAALTQAGYSIGFQELQKLTIGDRLVRVYEPGLATSLQEER